MPDPSRRVQAPDGTPIAVHSQGEGAPVVLVHGTACDHRVFARVARRLAKRFSVHAVDRRGRGDSDDADAYGFDREAEDIAAVCEAVAEGTAGPLGLIGHSLGGIVALEAAMRTDAIDRLVLYEPPIHGQQRPSMDAVDELDRLLETEGPAAVVEAFLTRVGYAPEDLKRLKANEALWQATVATAGTIPREARADLAYELNPFDLARVEIPVLCLLGGQSPPMFRDAVARLNANLAHARADVIEDASHAVLFEQPDRFVDAVEGFLDEGADQARS